MDPGSGPSRPHRRAGLAWHGPTGDESFTHPAVFYRTVPEYLSYTVPFILAGQAAGEPVAVAVPGPNLRAIHKEVAVRGGQVDDVRWLDMTDAGRNPGRIIPAVLRAFADRHTDRRVRIIGEPIWAGRGRTEYPACVQHEALINAAFAGRQATILCPYDAQHLSAVALADAEATHPILVADGQWWASTDYSPDSIVSAYNQPLATPGNAVEFPLTVESLSSVRRWATTKAAESGMDDDRRADIALVVTEMATNSVEHGRGAPRLQGWLTDTDLVFQTVNVGRLSDPLAGRIPAPANEPRGRGLLTANLLADLVRIYTTRDRTTVRACFRRPQPTPN
jgi:hypothetical protein